MSEEFYRESHGRIYRAMIDVHTSDGSVDALTLVEHLKQAGDLDDIEVDGIRGRAAIDLLAASAPDAANWRQHARIVRATAVDRERIGAAHALADSPRDANAIADVLTAITRPDGADGLRTRAIDWQRVRPIRWLWHRRIPTGLPSLLVGEEGIGKGTFAAWLIARATRGQLDGDLQGEPVRVLVIGDEDGFEPIWVPRLYAAGADLEMLRTLDDGEYLEDLRARADHLRAAVQRDRIGLVVLDQVLDHVPGGSEGQGVYNPKNVREALMPLRRVAG